MSAAEYRATLDELYRLRRFGMRPGLEVMQALLGRLGHPEHSFRAVHVTGSKGKGSVSAMAAAILSEVDPKVGLFTSPHLVSYRERIQVGRRPIPRSAVVDGVKRISATARDAEQAGDIDRFPTFFELTTLLAFDWFRRQGVRTAVVEVGLGGRLDSTNVVDAPVGVITTIELEHTEVLGPTLVEIAREKAGILKPGMHAVLGSLGDAPRAEVERIARSAGVPVSRLGVDLHVDGRDLGPTGQTFTVRTRHSTYPSLHLPLQGIFQPSNAALAVAAVEQFARASDRELAASAVRDGLARVRWRGRLERLAGRPEVFLDVAHTPESARAVTASLAEIYPFLDPEQNVVLFGCLSDKKAAEILDALSPLARTLIVAPLSSDRTMPGDELRRAGLGRFAKVVQAPDARAGIALARAAVGPDGFALVLGSDYLVGEVLRATEGGGDDEPDLSDPVRPAAPGGRR